MTDRNTTRAEIEEWNRNRCEALNALAIKSLYEVAGSSDLQDLKGLVHFYQGEAKQWRELFEQQRGAKAFMDIQMELIAMRYENRQLKKNTKDDHE